MTNLHQTIQLSDDATRRRDQMLGELLQDMHRVHARRRTRRRLALVSAAAVPILALAAAGALWLVSPNAPTAAPTGAEGLAPSEFVRFQPDPVIVRVTTDSTVLDRFRAPPVPSSTIILDDDMLLNELAAIDRPAGLVRSADRVWLTRMVADHIPAMNPPDASGEPSSRVEAADHAS